jgi:hypothetical protein
MRSLMRRLGAREEQLQAPPTGRHETDTPIAIDRGPAVAGRSSSRAQVR